MKGEVRKNVRMKAARALKEMSQEELAKTVGATRQTIGMIEAGNYNPSLNLCIAICRALDETLDGLFWETEKTEQTDKMEKQEDLERSK